jgi:hypothetical protein
VEQGPIALAVNAPLDFIKVDPKNIFKRRLSQHSTLHRKAAHNVQSVESGLAITHFSDLLIVGLA